MRRAAESKDRAQLPQLTQASLKRPLDLGKLVAGTTG